MSNELTVVQEQSLSVFANNEEFALANKIATQLSLSDLVPATYKNKPANCLIALDVARQVKNSPLLVMQNLNIILGKPSWSSTYISGVIHSRFQNVVIEKFGEGDKRGCFVVAIDRNGNRLEGASVTLEMAKLEGWYDKTGSKWKTMPDLMLQYRAMAFFGRVHCPDALIGLHSEFEVRDTAKVEKQEVIIENAFKPAHKEEIIEAEFSEVAPEESSLQCSNCAVSITEKVNKYSIEKHGKPLCMNCQKIGGGN